jgi:hypothetical protein
MKHVQEREDLHTVFWWGNMRKENHLDDSVIDGKIILKLIFKKRDGGIDGTVVAQDRNTCQALVNAVMNLRFPYNTGNLLTS